MVVLEHADATPGILGSAIIAGRATDLIDVEHLLGARPRDPPRRKHAA
jgi:hypothetical protein